MADRIILTQKNVTDFISEHRLENAVICLHSSMRSFGITESGPQTIIDPFIQKGATLIVPAFYYQAETNPPHGNYKRNGINYLIRKFDHPVNYTGHKDQIEPSMGIIPRKILDYPSVVRSVHPMGSFAGIGPEAERIVLSQSLFNIYGGYKKIYADYENAWIIMAGTDLSSSTPVHFAEECAGRTLFRRWAVMDNRTYEFEVGGCSYGFDTIRPLIRSIEKVAYLGQSKLLIYKFRPFIDMVTGIIRNKPEVTRCADKNCLCCEDIIKGGPILQSYDPYCEGY